MTVNKVEVKKEIVMLKEIHDVGMSIPLDLNDITALIDYVEMLEKQVNDYREIIDMVIIDLRDRDYIHLV